MTKYWAIPTLPLLMLCIKAGTLAIGCSVPLFCTAQKLHSLGRFTWFKKLILLIQTPWVECNRLWKDLGHPNTLKLAPTLALKSTIISRVADILTKLTQILFSVRNPLIYKKMSATCEIGMKFRVENCPHWVVWRICHLLTRRRQIYFCHHIHILTHPCYQKNVVQL